MTACAQDVELGLTLGEARMLERVLGAHLDAGMGLLVRLSTAGIVEAADTLEAALAGARAVAGKLNVAVDAHCRAHGLTARGEVPR